MFSNRITAAQQLAPLLKKYKEQPGGLVLAVPRGGVPIAYVIAKNLHLPLSLVLTKKIGHPANEEYAIGAVSLTDRYLVSHKEVSPAYIDEATTRIRKRLREMYHMYLGDRQPEPINGKTVIVVDDGIATGNTLLATVKMLRKENPAKIIVAAPVASQNAYAMLSKVVDELIILHIPTLFRGVGAFYDDFAQVTNEEVIYYLAKERT
ncbi:phosphoribosyltransferase [Chitinophaga oryzae]|uniref:Phosphoribosyltransferase n=1 Tax=Chitinophaga oryzae TaxID=2725414 RepID=A0AAE6ZC85_9BACT|nr:phosphoribosyltransferase family protein [Chitinophaga oryzae]QJB30158.1 phosphoribosyltransferase [Chitinophaga oryzae]QJB36656.1 phosphoribosyltransferase [Chitinophaga oryzae]